MKILRQSSQASFTAMLAEPKFLTGSNNVHAKVGHLYITLISVICDFYFKSKLKTGRQDLIHKIRRTLFFFSKQIECKMYLLLIIRKERKLYAL